jgi:quercetin dioxygenase-like cupin family protein
MLVRKTLEERLMPTRTGSLTPYGIVALIAAGLSAAVTWQGSRLVSPSLAQTAAGSVRQILSQPLPDLPGREVRILLIDRPPEASSPAHRHPGHHSFGYIIDGAYEFAIDGQSPRLLKAGDTFYEPTTAVHSTSRNPSKEQALKMIVFMVADQKNPTTVRE